MKQFVYAAILLTASATSALAAAPMAHDHHGATVGKAVAHTHVTTTAGDVKTTFHFNPAQDAKLTCSMHPEVTATKPGTCPKCKMDLAKQTHSIGLGLESVKSKQPIIGAKVQLAIADASGMSQTLSLAGTGHYIGQFHLMPGKHVVTAVVTPAGGKTVTTKVPYEVK